MSDITLSKGVRQNLLTLQQTADLLSKTQERLATGRKVNSALDNPINFFTSSGLTARANDLSRLLDSVGNAVQTVQAADKGISAITKLIESAQATARQALTSAAPAATYDLDIEGTVAFADDVAAVTGTVGALTGGTTLDTLGLATVKQSRSRTAPTPRPLRLAPTQARKTWTTSSPR
jgi:flagellin